MVKMVENDILKKKFILDFRDGTFGKAPRNTHPSTLRIKDKSGLWVFH